MKLLQEERAKDLVFVSHPTYVFVMKNIVRIHGYLKEFVLSCICLRQYPLFSEEPSDILYHILCKHFSFSYEWLSSK